MSSLQHESEFENSRQCTITSMIKRMQQKGLPSTSSETQNEETDNERSSDSTLEMDNIVRTEFDSQKDAKACFSVTEDEYRMQDISAARSRHEMLNNVTKNGGSSVNLYRPSSELAMADFLDLGKVGRQVKDYNRLQLETVSGAKMSLKPADVPTKIFPFHSSCETFTGDADQCENFTCPICNFVQSGIDLGAFNRHIDLCLNRTTVSDILNGDRTVQSSGVTCSLRYQ